MKLLLTSFLLTLASFSCSNPKNELTEIRNDYEIDLTNLDSVRENLNGFWIEKDIVQKDRILWLSFHKTKNIGFWETIPYNNEVKKTEALPMNSHSPIAELIKIDGKVNLIIVKLNKKDTIKIESFYKTKFEINESTYLRHKGYDFLKEWKIHDYD